MDLGFVQCKDMFTPSDNTSEKDQRLRTTDQRKNSNTNKEIFRLHLRFHSVWRGRKGRFTATKTNTKTKRLCDLCHSSMWIIKKVYFAIYLVLGSDIAFVFVRCKRASWYMYTKRKTKRFRWSLRTVDRISRDVLVFLSFCKTLMSARLCGVCAG